MIFFIDESGDTGFKFDKGSSKYFILANVVFETTASIIEAVNLIQDLKEKSGYKENFEFHFTHNRKRTINNFLKAISKMNFYWSAIIIDKQLLHSPRMKENGYLMSKVASYLCNHWKVNAKEVKIIFDQKDSQKFYRSLSKYLKAEFNVTDKIIKDIRSADSKKELLLQVADYCAGVVNQMHKNPEYGSNLYAKYIRLKCKKIQIWPKK
jgi:hypothetical protein